MIIPRLVSLALRISQFLCAAVVLGLTAYLLHLTHKHSTGPFGRLTYTVVLSATSTLASLIWMLPTTPHMVNLIGDLLFCGAWFAVFALLQDWYEDSLGCGSTWAWSQMGREGRCGQWNAAQAFAFLAAVFWFASFVLGVVVWSAEKRDRGRGA
ncbi:hypothetical protein BDW02DRAFT_465340, partial [Decorospora gaudefroyi]